MLLKTSVRKSHSSITYNIIPIVTTQQTVICCAIARFIASSVNTSARSFINSPASMQASSHSSSLNARNCLLRSRQLSIILPIERLARTLESKYYVVVLSLYLCCSPKQTLIEDSKKLLPRRINSPNTSSQCIAFFSKQKRKL